MERRLYEIGYGNDEAFLLQTITTLTFRAPVYREDSAPFRFPLSLLPFSLLSIGAFLFFLLAGRLGENIATVHVGFFDFSFFSSLCFSLYVMCPGTSGVTGSNV